MTRPSKNTDKKLIQAALELLPETGYSGLKMRAVAKRAGVNLGMFHYYFQSKEEFLERVATEFYEKFYTTFTMEAATGVTALERMQNAIVSLAGFGKKNRKLVLALAKDVLENEQQIVRILEKLFPRHGVILIKLIRQCQQEGLIGEFPLPIVITFIMGSVFGPIIIMTLLERIRLKAPYEWIKKMVLPLLLSDSAMEQRMELAFRALAPSTGVTVRKKRASIKMNAQIDQWLMHFQAAQTASAKTLAKPSQARRKK